MVGTRRLRLLGMLFLLQTGLWVGDWVDPVCSFLGAVSPPLVKFFSESNPVNYKHCPRGTGGAAPLCAEACAALNVRLALGPDLVLFTVPRPYGTFLVDCKPPKPKLYDFPTTGVPCIELEDGCAYMIPAGEVGSVDYLVEHMTYAHPLGPGEEWAGVEQPERKAWVYRAVKPSHAQWYSQHWPHQMCPPSHAELLYGESQRDKVWG